MSENNNDQPKHIVIMGAGLVGSMHAIYLARRGYQVSVYEQLPDIRKEAISAGRSINLALANRGIDALDRLGLMDQVNELLIPMQGRMLHDEQGQLKFQSYGQKPEEVIYSVSRAGLVSILRDAAEATGQVEFFFKHECVAIDFEQHNCTVNSQVQGQTVMVDYDYLIGADGGGSQVRESMKNRQETEFTAELLDHSYKELNIPPGPDGVFQLEKEALHIWPRDDYMMIGLPNPDGSFTLTLFMPNEGPVSFASINDEPALHALFDAQFADAKPMIPELVNDYFNNPTGYLGTIRCHDWQFSRAVLTGDAAHAIVPFHGQGMNAGFEDCVAMDKALDLYQDDWQLAMSAFVESRMANSNAIADMALENYVEMRATVNDPKFHLKKAIAFELERRLPEYFIPRYSMVMFHLIPYAQAFSRGKIQAKILTDLSTGIEAVEQVDFARAERLVKQKLPRFQHG